MYRLIFLVRKRNNSICAAVYNKFTERILWLANWKRYDVCRENFRDRTLRLSFLCLGSLSSLIYPISFWISENSLGFCFSPARYAFLFGLGYILCALHFTPLFLFIHTAPFVSLPMFKLILSIPRWTRISPCEYYHVPFSLILLFLSLYTCYCSNIYDVWT